MVEAMLAVDSGHSFSALGASSANSWSMIGSILSRLTSFKQHAHSSGPSLT